MGKGYKRIKSFLNLLVEIIYSLPGQVFRVTKRIRNNKNSVSSRYRVMSKMTDKRDQYIKTITNAFMYATNVLENHSRLKFIWVTSN